tara:strand:- start:74 stop:940 length:867 start_codon:yes stop_codon:yes gene_type:complete
MAIFEDNRELSTQKKHVGMDKVKGFKKTLLSVMGYKDTGERNAWGRTGIAGTLGMATAGGSRLLAKGLAKGSDAHQVMKETDDEYLSAGLAKGKFLYESGKAVASLIVPGAEGAEGAEGLMKGGKTSTTPDLATTPINKTSNIADSTAGQNLANMITQQSNQDTQDVVSSNVDSIIGKKSDSELLKSMGDNYMLDDSGEKIYKDGFGGIVEDMTQEEYDAKTLADKQAKRKKQQEQTSNLLDKIPVIGGVASSGLELVAAQKNYTQEAEKEAMKFKRKTASETAFNLL